MKAVFAIVDGVKVKVAIREMDYENKTAVVFALDCSPWHYYVPGVGRHYTNIQVVPIDTLVLDTENESK